MRLKKIKRKILYIPFIFLGLINRLISKNPNQIVMYSNLGFRDNVKVLFDYLIENKYNNKYKIICSLNDYKKYTNTNIPNVKFINNIIGIYYYLTSKYFFYSFGKYPMKPTKEQTVINLWHGSPLKKIGNLEDDKKRINYNFFTYILATSDMFSKIMQQAFNCNDEQIIICGHPRNDLLFKDKLSFTDQSKKLVVWLPTFRKSDRLDEVNSTTDNYIPIFTTREKLESLENFLEKRNIYLIIKLHPMQNFNSIDCSNYRNIEIWSEDDINDRNINLYRLLGSSDALITDYSSVYFDYLLLDKPIGFTVDDMELYIKDRGFIFNNPEEYMPGKKIHNEYEFYEFINNLCINKDEYVQERKKINDLANCYKDGNNCRRVLNMVGINI